MYAPPRPNTRAQKPPATRAPGHRDDGFCNRSCEKCEREMARRSDRYARNHSQAVNRLMREPKS